MTPNKIQKNEAGFSVFELLVIMVVVGLLSASLLLRFRASATSKVVLQRNALLVVESIRRAQNLAVTSAKFKGDVPCGYGIHFVSSSEAFIYFGSKPNPSDSCSVQNQNYNSPPDKEFTKIKFNGQNVEFKASFADVFFEPPNPTTFINNSSASASISITIGKIGGTCPQDCKTINVSTSGTIE